MSTNSANPRAATLASNWTVAQAVDAFYELSKDQIDLKKELQSHQHPERAVVMREGKGISMCLEQGTVIVTHICCREVAKQERTDERYRDG